MLICFGYTITYAQTKNELATSSVDTLFTGTIKFKEWSEAHLKVLLFQTEGKIDSLYFYGKADKTVIEKTIVSSNFNIYKTENISLHDDVDELIQISLGKNFSRDGGVLSLDIKFGKKDLRNKKIYISRKKNTFKSYIKSIKPEYCIDHIAIELEAFFLVFGITIDSYTVYNSHGVSIHKEKD